MGRYQEKMAEKNRKDYIRTKTIYLDDYGTYVTSVGKGRFAVVGNGCRIDVDTSGNVNISGTSVKIDSKNFDFSELPDRYIRDEGISWSTVVNNSQVIAALPIRIKGKKVYIPCLNVDID